jgi:hypothetical protein
MAWRIVVTFGDGATGVYSSEYSAAATPDEAYRRLVAFCASATDAELAEIGATRAALTPVGYRLADGWYPVRSFIDRYGGDGDAFVGHLQAAMKGKK